MILNRWPKCVLKGEKIMEEILRQDISQVQSSIVTLSVTAVALALLPVICVVLWRRRCGKSASFVPVFIGAAGFFSISPGAGAGGAHGVHRMGQSRLPVHQRKHPCLRALWGLHGGYF